MSDLFTDLAGDLERDLPRCPRGAIISALADTWRDFCRRALVWRPVFTLNVVEGQTSYPITITQNADVVQVEEVRWRSESDVTAGAVGLKLGLSAYDIGRDTNGRLVLALKQPPVASVSGGITVRIALAPVRNSTVLEDEDLFLRYQDGIKGGALAELAGKPRRPWSSPSLAQRGRSDFYNAVSNGLADRIRNFAPGHTTMVTA
jgi:hypothetical protein